MLIDQKVKAAVHQRPSFRQSAKRMTRYSPRSPPKNQLASHSERLSIAAHDPVGVVRASLDLTLRQEDEEQKDDSQQAGQVAIAELSQPTPLGFTAQKLAQNFQNLPSDRVVESSSMDSSSEESSYYLESVEESENEEMFAEAGLMMWDDDEVYVPI